MMTTAKRTSHQEICEDSSVSPEEVNLNTKANDEILTDYSQLIPDGGWGWFVVLASLLTHIVSGGLERSSGIFYLRFYDQFGKSAAYTSWVTSIPSSLRLLLGPMCSALCHRFTCRQVVIGGAIFVAVTMVISAFATSLEFLLISYGIIGGVAKSFIYSPVVMMVAMYFDKKRSIANGISTSGAGIGTLGLPPLIDLLFQYYGFQGAFIIVAGIILHLCIAGLLLRPLSFQRKLIAFDDRKKMSQNHGQKIMTNGERSNCLSRDQLNIEIDVPSKQNNMVDSTFNNSSVYHEDDEQYHENSHCTDPLYGSQTCVESKEENISKTRSWKTNCIKKYIPCCKNSKENTSKTEKSVKLLHLSVLADLRYLTLCIALLLFIIASQSAFVFLPAYGRQVGVSDIKSAILVAIMGTSDGFGRIISGIILDIKSLKRYRLWIYNVIMYFVAAGGFVIPFTRSYLELGVFCGIYGFLMGAFISQKATVMVDILGSDKIISAFGILSSFQGLGLLFGPLLAGYLKDINGTYDYAFYVGGICVLIGACILTFGNVIHKVNNKRKGL